MVTISTTVLFWLEWPITFGKSRIPGERAGAKTATLGLAEGTPVESARLHFTLFCDILIHFPVFFIHFFPLFTLFIASNVLGKSDHSFGPVSTKPFLERRRFMAFRRGTRLLRTVNLIILKLLRIIIIHVLTSLLIPFIQFSIIWFGLLTIVNNRIGLRWYLIFA